MRLRKIQLPGKAQFKVTTKAVSGAKGYQVRYSLKSSMASSKTVSFTGTSKSVTKLAKKKKYYVQVRAYKKDSTGANVYGSWSAKKTVTTKK